MVCHWRLPSQQSHNVVTASLQRHVVQRRCNDAVATLCVCWMKPRLSPMETMETAHYLLKGGNVEIPLFEPQRQKTYFWTLRPVKIQIRLQNRAIRSESSLGSFLASQGCKVSSCEQQRLEFKSSLDPSKHTTSLQRRCNVTMLQRRCNDVVATLFVCWDAHVHFLKLLLTWFCDY